MKLKPQFTKTIFISQLPQETQENIKKDLLDYYDMDFADYDDTLQESLELAMNGRLCDIDEIININKYL